jgi:agmatine deiminase
MKTNILLVIVSCFVVIGTTQNLSLLDTDRWGEQEDVRALVPIPPPGPVRTMAEWEEVQAIVISWYPPYTAVLKQIVEHSIKECRVIILTYDENAVVESLSDIPDVFDHVQIVDALFTSPWVRDYGPWTIYQNDVDSLMLVDWVYDRLDRIYDDATPATVAEALQLDHYEAIEAPYRWIHAGGNLLRDGMGTFFSSALVFETNPMLSEDEIDTIAALFLGAERYFKLPVLPYDGIHHLDMHMCMLDEETLLVGEYPEGVADGPQIEANLEVLRQWPTAFGNEYNIVRIPMPPDNNGLYPDEVEHYRTYTNSIFVNNTILVPVYEEQYDTTALRIYEEMLPAYTIAPVYCDNIVDEYGAVHCITKLIGVADPLWIAHPRLKNQAYNETGYPVQAIIRHQSGIEQAAVYFREKGMDTYEMLPMELEIDGRWRAILPAFEEETSVEYYIQATAYSGKVQQRPMPAPEGYFRFNILGATGTKARQTPPLKWEVYPNPADEYCQLQASLEQAGRLKLSLVSASGQVVWEEERIAVAAPLSYRIPTKNIPSGSYQLNILWDNGQQTVPILVVH